jgi:hypothetical protein
MELGTLKIEELGRRAVECARWRWMPGMLVRYPDGYHERIEDDTDATARFEDDGLPDLTDPATVGCLLALVRDAWGDPTIGAVQAGDYKTTVAGLTIPSRSHWVVMRAGAVGLESHGHGNTEAAALVAALEAAP